MTIFYMKDMDVLCTFIINLNYSIQNIDQAKVDDHMIISNF